MKKTLRLVAIALVAMAMTTACNNKNAEEVVDSTAMDTVEEVVVEEEVTPVEEVAEATNVKKEVKAEEEQAIKTDAEAHQGDRKGGLSVSTTKAETNFKSNDAKSHMGARGGALSTKEE